MQDKYKLCKRAGLEIQEHRVIVGFSRGEYGLEEADFVRAADVEKMLEGAPVVYGRPDIDPKDGFMFGWSDCRTLDGNEEGYYPDTHTARLVMIEPITPKSLEDKILEVLDDHSKSATESLTAIRRLLEGK